MLLLPPKSPDIHGEKAGVKMNSCLWLGAIEKTNECLIGAKLGVGKYRIIHMRMARMPPRWVACSSLVSIEHVSVKRFLRSKCHMARKIVRSRILQYLLVVFD